MGIIRKDFKYKLIENFLTEEERKVYNTYCKLKHQLNMTSFDTKQNKNGDTFFYADPLFEALMLEKTKLMEENTGLQLFPTYAFWRMYTYLADLDFHTDRSACEISVTVNIGSSGESWPIFMDGNAVEIKPGAGVIYLGCELEHGRKEFIGDWCAQCFLHYVDKNGPYAEHEKDKRLVYGAPR